MGKRISEERKAAYYIGGMISILGAILFLSLFVTVAMNIGNHSFDPKSAFVRAFTGFFLIIVGRIISTIGARGLAGSGVVLDPEKARDELEPYSRMAGGMVKDALDEADINLGGKSEKVIMVRCLACSKLNEEDSKFCQECGQKI
ncbi:MAG: zinc ribbon domain-containing protein [Phycisphaerae bacterium]|nr:zinc ribbon domain-containing protein [Phycisphaerae bacterium]